MPAIITEAITERNYELVRDAIGFILTLELGNQKTLQNLPETIKVYQERSAAIEESENLYINVLWDSVVNSSFTQAGREGLTLYYIDVYTTGMNRADNTPGDMDSAKRLHKYLRMCDYILSTNKYVTLGFNPGVIAGKQVQNIATAEPSPLTEGSTQSFQRMGRITFAVRIYEDQQLATGPLWNGSDTVMKIEPTEKGYLYSVTII